MSHFAVLVIGDNVEEQLAKYDESIEMPRYVKHTKEELIVEEKQSIEEYKNGTYAQYLADPVKYAENVNNENHLKYVSEEFPKKLEMNDEEIYQQAIKYYEEEYLGPDGEVYSTYNPDSKWDWYEVGGRYAGRIAVKDGVEIDEPNFSWGWQEEDKEKVIAEGYKTDSAYVGDIDFSKMHRTEEDYNEALRYWELIVEGAKPKNEDETNQVKWNWYKPEYYTERYKDKETYAKCNSSFSMWAVVKDGVWYEKGQMGWWAMSNETHDEALDWEMNFYDRFIKDLPEDTLITVVDCHI
jgi:hypothetical protein